MKQTTNKLFLLTLLLIVHMISGCALTQGNQNTSAPPVCVTLELYDEVLGQQFTEPPNWKLLNQIKGYGQYQWVLQNTTGTHSLNTVLSPIGCICAARAKSQFHFGDGEENLVGLLEGAAIVPLSDLNFTTRWLEPKISISCTLANILHRTYSAESEMKDGTIWKLTCSRPPGDTNTDSTYEFSVTASDCLVTE